MRASTKKAREACSRAFQALPTWEALVGLALLLLIEVLGVEGAGWGSGNAGKNRKCNEGG